MSSVVKLGGLVSFRTGKLNSNAATPDGAYPFFTCSQETYRTNTFSFDTECVLLAGNNANGIYPIKYFNGRFDAYQRTYVIESLNKKILLTRFLFYALRLQLTHLRSVSTGSATKFLTMPLLTGIEVRLPSLATQERIVSILSAYDDLIENNTRRIAILEEMARRLFEEWFVRFRFPGHEGVPMVESELGLVPQGWRIRLLGDEIELPYGKALKAENRSAGEVPVYGSSGVVGCHSTSLVPGPGIIVGRKGNVGSVHWCDVPFFPIDTVFYVKTALPLHFVYFNLQQQNFLNNDAAVPGLNRNQAYALPLLVPDTDVLNHFEELCGQLLGMARLLSRKNVNLRTTRDLLLPKLISGELDVSTLPEPQAETV